MWLGLPWDVVAGIMAVIVVLMWVVRFGERRDGGTVRDEDECMVGDAGRDGGVGLGRVSREGF